MVIFKKILSFFLHLYAGITLLRIIFLQGPFGFFEMQYVQAGIQQFPSLF